MKRTGIPAILIVTLVSAFVAFFGENVFGSLGLALMIPPPSLWVTLLIVACVIVCLAIPIRRAVTSQRKKRIDPFVAVRVAVLAKASTLCGAIFSGLALGVLCFLLAHSFQPSLSSAPWMMTLATVISGLILLAAGLVSEFFCSIPPDQHDDEEETASA